MNNHVIYVGTTIKCSACKCIETILKRFQELHPTFGLVVDNFVNLPTWIRTSVPLDGYPIVVFVKDSKILHHFTGTRTMDEIRNICDKIGF